MYPFGTLWSEPQGAPVFQTGDWYTGSLNTSPYPGSSGSYYTIPAAEVENLRRICVNKLLLKIKDQKVNLVQMYAEKAQTAEMFAKTALRLVETISALRKGHFNVAAAALGVNPFTRAKRRFSRQYAKDQSKAVANGWLELQYGWLPLISDCFGAAELIAQKQFRELRVKASTFVNMRRTSYSDTSDSRWRTQNWAATELKCKYTVYFGSSYDALHTLSQVGITNPAYIAWELLPYSFVVDWFWPLGNWINTWDATNGLDFKDGCLTYVTKAENNCLTSGRAGTLYRGTAWGSQKKITISRTKITSFPFVGFPSLKSPVSYPHLANALALLTQTFKR